MHTATKQDMFAAPPGAEGNSVAGDAGRGGPDAALPDVVIRFPAIYAVGAMGFGVLFFFLGLWIASVNPHRNVRFGLFSRGRRPPAWSGRTTGAGTCTSSRGSPRGSSS